MTRVLTTNQPDAEGFELRSNNAGNFLTRVEDFDSNWIVDAYAAALAVTDWYLDAVTGNDQNDGLTPATALQTGTELQRRLGPQARWTASVTVHIGTGGVQSLCLRGETAAAGVSVDIIGTPTLVADAGTVSAYTAMDHATPRSPTLTCTGVTDWTSYVGMRVRLTSGANAGACTWILKANPDGLGLAVARTSAWYKKNDLVPTTSMSSTGAPTVGNTIVIETLPAINDLELELYGVTSLAGGNSWPQRQYAIDSLSITSLSRKSSCDRIDANRSIVFGCRLSFQTTDTRLGSSFSSALAVSCLLWTVGNTSINLGGSFSGLGTLNVLSITSVSAGSLVINQSVLQGTSLSLPYGVSGFVTGMQVFDIVSATAPAFSVWSGTFSNISGNNNAGYGYLFANRCNATLSSTQNLTGAVANVILGATGSVLLPLTVTLASLLPINDFARSGTAKLVAGTVTVTVPHIDWSVQQLTFGRSNPAGTIGDLSAPTASRTTTSFVINSSNALDTSDVQWSISPLKRNIFVSNAS